MEKTPWPMAEVERVEARIREGVELGGSDTSTRVALEFIKYCRGFLATLRDVDALRVAYFAALQAEFDAHPEAHGKIFRPKPGGSAEYTIRMQFSRTLLDFAGGWEALQRDWEVE